MLSGELRVEWSEWVRMNLLSYRVGDEGISFVCSTWSIRAKPHCSNNAARLQMVLQAGCLVSDVRG